MKVANQLQQKHGGLWNCDVLNMTSASSQKSCMSFLTNKDKAIQRKDSDRLCCEKCRFSTKDIDLFERHVAHHDEVTFSCALCSYVSYSKTESQKHVVSHTGSYPYRCSFCSYGAVRRDYMVKHINRIHKRHADGGFVSDFELSTPQCQHPSVPDAHRMSGWPERNEQCVIPNTTCQSKGNAHVEYFTGNQHRNNMSSATAKTVSQTGHKQAHVTFTTSQSVTSTTNVSVAKRPFTGAVGSCSPGQSHPVSNTLQVILKSREENGNIQLSNSLLVGDGQSRVGNGKAVSEVAGPKAFSRVHAGFLANSSSCTEPLLQSPVNVAADKANHLKTAPRVQIRLPAGKNTPLRPLLNMPTAALSQRTVQIKHSDRPLTSTQRGQTAENSNQPRALSGLLEGSPAEKSGSLASVQVELLAPLNQPIQHNRPLTVSCPEEINIPAGCLVELVEVKNVNGTRELELRLVPPNGFPQDLRGTTDGQTDGSSVATAGKLSFKCHVATTKGCTVGPSKSFLSCVVDQQPSLACTDVQSITTAAHSAHKPLDAASHRTNKQNLKTVSEPSASREPVTPDGTALSSEGLPVISSVYSLCPTPASALSISQSVPEFYNSTSQKSMPVMNKLQGEFKRVSDLLSGVTTANESKENVKSTECSVVCSLKIKKEEEPEEKHKAEDLKVKETKTESESEAYAQEKTEAGKPKITSEESSDLNTSDMNEISSMTRPLTPPSVEPKQISSSNTDCITNQPELESGSNTQSQNHSSTASLMNPKVTLVRIPSSLIKSTKNVPEAETQEESVTARPVLCCTLNKQNVSSVREGAIKLILKREPPVSKKKDKDHDAPPRKKHKKDKRRAKKHGSSPVVMGLHQYLTKGSRELRLTPLKDDQLIKRPAPNQPVVVLNHPNPLAQMVSVGVQTLKDYKWIRSMHHVQEQTEAADLSKPVRKQPSFKMKLKKVQGQKYQVIEFVLKGVSDKLLV